MITSSKMVMASSLADIVADSNDSFDPGHQGNDRVNGLSGTHKGNQCTAGKREEEKGLMELGRGR